MTNPIQEVLNANYTNSESTPWFPYRGNSELKIFKLNPVTGQMVALLRIPADDELGLHFHSGTVIVYTLAGSWSYKEHDWVAKKGDLIYEPASSIHTLYTPPGDEETVLFVVLEGVLQFLDENGNQIVMDTWKTIYDLYANYCTENNIEMINITSV